LISTRRLVPQQTVQIMRPSAGQLRFGFRFSQRGQATRKLYTPLRAQQSPENFGRYVRAVASECRFIINVSENQHR